MLLAKLRNILKNQLKMSFLQHLKVAAYCIGMFAYWHVCGVLMTSPDTKRKRKTYIKRLATKQPDADDVLVLCPALSTLRAVITVIERLKK